MKKYYLFILLIVLFPLYINAQQSFDNVDFSGRFFLSYEHDVYNEMSTQQFAIKRGYITFRSDLNNRFRVRFTQDVTIDQSGDGTGDIELRLKYALLEYQMKSYGFLHAPAVEAGVVHRPWIDFEQDINDYRAQKSMFLDQNDIIASADYGIQFSAGLGEPIQNAGAKGLRTNSSRYGSFALGVYNGGGYSNLERNSNKLIEGRITLRPLPYRLEGLQTSFLGVLGKGNIPEAPDFRLAAAALTYESNMANIMLQGFTGLGDGEGRFINQETLEPQRIEGWSVFSELKPEFTDPIRFTIRYDEFYNYELNQLMRRQWVGGLAYVFRSGSKIIVDVSRENNALPDNNISFTRIELVGEIRF
jgi:hypothetical protein